MREDLIQELNRLSEFWDIYKDRMREIAKELVKDLDRSRICKYWIQRESCRQCLFENLCLLESNKQ